MQKLTDKALQERKNYYKQYRQTHKEQIKEYNRKYWEKKAQKGQTEND